VWFVCGYFVNWSVQVFSLFVYNFCFLVLRHQTMDKVHKHNSVNTNTLSSESYRSDLVLTKSVSNHTLLTAREFRNFHTWFQQVSSLQSATIESLWMLSSTYTHFSGFTVTSYKQLFRYFPS
jgi:hypothetical protein